MKAKLFKVGNDFYYYHKTEGWLSYRYGTWTWQYSLIGYFDDELSKILKPATPKQFEKKHNKNLQRSIKTATQKHRRALERLRKLLSGEIEVDDSKMMLGS